MIKVLELQHQSMHAKSLQWCPTLCNPEDCNLPGSSVHGILKARTLEYVAISATRGSSQPQGPNLCLLCLLHCQAGSLPLSPPRKSSNRPSNEYSGLISFRMDWLDLLAVQGTLKGLLQHHTSKASIQKHWDNSRIKNGSHSGKAAPKTS